MGISGALEVMEAVGTAYGAAKIVTAGHGGMLASAVGNSPTPKPKPPPSMPDLTQVNQAQLLQESKDAAARYGRAATILTSNSDTGDRLGP